MTELIVARRHALALFELAVGEGSQVQVGDELLRLKEAVTQNPEWMAIMDDSRIGMRIKRKMVEEMSTGLHLHAYCRNLIGLLAEKKYVHLLPEVAGSYMKRLHFSEGRVETHVTVVDERIWKELQDEIGSVVATITGKRPVFDFHIDKDIIGGIIIKIGDEVYDGSVRGELKRFKEELQDKVARLN